MPRKQRFKPSRKPKQVESTSESTTANENGSAQPTRQAVIVSDQSTPREDVSSET
jgi:hypothetical protein